MFGACSRPFVILCALLSAGTTFVGAATLEENTSTDIYPTVYRSDGFNSTEHAENLGVTPLTLLSNEKLIGEDPWSTALISGCPRTCADVGHDPGNWTQIHGIEELLQCEQPLLFDLNIQNTPTKHATIRSCAAVTTRRTSGAKRRALASPSLQHRSHKLHQRSHNQPPIKASHVGTIGAVGASPDSCGAAVSTVKADLFVGPPGVNQAGSDTVVAAGLLGLYLQDGDSCGTTLLFAKFGSAAVGLYVGADLHKPSVGRLIHDLKTRFADGTQVIQSCNAGSPIADTLGLISVDYALDFGKAQNVVKSWADGDCSHISAALDTQENIQMGILTAGATSNSSLTEVVVTRRSQLRAERERGSTLTPRADCSVARILAKDSCASLAARCGIRGADFLKYNTKTNLCNTLVPDQYVCCSAGSLPDTRPKPQDDGTCATHTVRASDGCWAIADSYGIKVEELEEFNKGTWGWSGCGRLQLGQIICLSKGNTPMPAAVEGVACGPQKPGTRKPSGTFDGWDLAKLNQCPLNSCCSGWGFCGTTEEFCTNSPADSGAPGAFEPGTAGCISNCGMDIVGNETPPGEFARVGYFQAYNGGRDCLNMDVLEITELFKDLTHVHFAFLGLTTDFNVRIPDNVKDQFQAFTEMQGSFRKIVSLGGWAESTDAATYKIYRDAVLPGNRIKFANNVLDFVTSHNLDGVDFDWEYPGAKDMPIIPVGSEQEAQQYLRFLTVMRSTLDLAGLGETRKSLSIALPASYWYLKPFPIKEMAAVCDYFIYMTYDFHGQWDYGNKFASPGCPDGSCLRSHINITETHNALSMITKAGVPARQIFVGISSYGRSFRMADPACTGPTCLFTGSRNHSDAEAGQCTGTGGYISNAELSEIYQYATDGLAGWEAKKWYDAATDSDIMTYGTRGQGMTDWVSYMAGATKTRRIDWIKGLNFGGTTDWAIDLAEWAMGTAPEGGGQDDTEPEDAIIPCDSFEWPDTLDKLESSTDLPPRCHGEALVKILLATLTSALADYQTVSADYDDKFGWYVDWVKDAIDDRLDEFVKVPGGKGLPFMDCKVWTKMTDGEQSGPCAQATLPYPPGPSPGPRDITYTLKDKEGFYDALLNEAGIEESWIYWMEKDAEKDFCPPCPGGLQNCDEYVKCQVGGNSFIRRNLPRRIKDTSKIDVPNPKQIVDEAIPDLNVLLEISSLALAEIECLGSDISLADMATALSLPIFMLQDSAVSITEIKKIGEEQKKTKTLDLVMLILEIVMSVIPFGRGAAAIFGGASRLARIARIAGHVGEAGLTVAEVINDPASAPFIILDALLGGFRGGKKRSSKEAFQDAAAGRKGLEPSQLKLFSESFQKKDMQVQNILSKVVQTCKR